MSTFDGSTGASRPAEQHPADRPGWGHPSPGGYPTGRLAADTRQDEVPERADIPGMPDADVPSAPFDALEALREQMAQREEEAEHTLTVDVPGLDWRLVCDYDLSYKQFSAMQKASLPRNQRNGRKFNPLDLDQATLCTLVLLRTCVGMEYRDSRGEWQSLLDSKQQPMIVNSAELMDRFGAVDENAFLRKLFGGDARVIRAGQEVMEAAGYGESEGEIDPLDGE